jgi:colanic acid biosynthesis glycosyl transferase WcaI
MLGQIPWCPQVVLLVEPTLFCSPQALCVARLSNAIAWLHIQDFEIDVAFQLRYLSSGRLRRWIQSFERFVLEKFDRISAISERMVERLSDKGVETARSLLFPNWVDTSIIYPMRDGGSFRQELGIPKQKIVALYSGNLGMKQGLGLLVEVCRQLTSRRDIQFVFCGEGPYRETLAKLASEVRNVTVLQLQPSERLNELLNTADVHLLPQLADAADLVMPSKLTGMMASGRAIVATAHPGTQVSTVLEGRGIVTPPGDIAAFAAAIIQLAESSDLRRRLGIEGRKYAVEHMSRDEILAQFELSMMKICGQPPPAAQHGLSAGESC